MMRENTVPNCNGEGGGNDGVGEDVKKMKEQIRTIILLPHMCSQYFIPGRYGIIIAFGPDQNILQLGSPTGN